MKSLLLSIMLLLICAISNAQNLPSSLQQGMVFRWTGDERYPLRDHVSGVQGTGTSVYNTPSRTGDGANRYYTLNGSSDYITLPTGITFGTSDFSVIMKVDFKELGRAQSLIGSQSFVLYINSSNKIVSGKNNVGDNTASTTSITLGIHTIQYIRTGTSATYYIDGVADNTITDNRDYSTVLQWIGKLDNTYFLNASVYMARCFNYALSSVVNYSKPEYPIEWVDRGATTNLITNGTFTGSTTDWVIEASGWAYNSNNIISTASNGYIYHTTVGSGTDRQILVSITASNVQGSPYVKLGGVGNYDTVHGFTIVNGTQTKSIHSYTDFPNYLFIHNANGGAGTIVDDVSAYYQGCVLDLNSSGLSRASDGSYNTGYWTDRTNSITATVSGATSVIPPASNLNATKFIGSTGGGIKWTNAAFTALGSSDRTISFNIYLDALGGDQFIYDGCGMRIQIVSYGSIYVMLGSEIGPSSVSLAAKTWYNITLTYSGGICKAYFNNVLALSASGTAMNTTQSDFSIGNINQSGYPISAIMKDFIVWKRVLSADEIKLLNDIN